MTVRVAFNQIINVVCDLSNIYSPYKVKRSISALFFINYHFNTFPIKALLFILAQKNLDRSIYNSDLVNDRFLSFLCINIFIFRG